MLLVHKLSTTKTSAIDFNLLLHIYGENGVIPSEKLTELEGKFASQKLFQDFKCLVEFRDVLIANSENYPLENLFFGKKNVEFPISPSQNLIFKTSQNVAKLLWRLFDILSQEKHPFLKEAERFHKIIFKSSFDKLTLKNQFTELTDRILHEEGFPYFVLASLTQMPLAWVHGYLNDLLPQKSLTLTESEKSLYWFSEILLFIQKHKESPLNERELLKNIYPVIFLTPERGGLLEIDGPFYQEFEMIQEMVKEGLLYREELIDSLFELWSRFENWFDQPFLTLFEEFFPLQNKVYQHLETLSKVWDRERESFSKDYLWVIEANLSYWHGDYASAQFFLEKALNQSPQLLVARINLLFVLARLKNSVALEKEVQWLKKVFSTIPPQVLFSIAGSFLILKDFKSANQNLEILRKEEIKNLDLQVSIFCLDQGFADLALEFAKQASLVSQESSVAYQLSRCYEKLGEKETALSTLSSISQMQDSMLFYRFTLQRDLGLYSEAEEGLKNLSRNQLEERELEEVIRFSKERNNLSLLRQFKK